MAHETSASGTTNPGPDERSGEQESPANPPQTGEPVESDRRVPLDRLLSVVTLTPAQAALVAVQLLDATHLRGTADGVFLVDAGLGAVILTPCGDVDVAPPQAAEGTRVTELLEQLLQNARRLPAHPRPEQLVLLRRLEEATAGSRLDPGARARELEGALADVLGPSASRRLSGQLAALVDAFCRIAPRVQVPVDALPAAGPQRAVSTMTGAARTVSRAHAGSPPAPHRAAPTRSTPSRPPRRGQALGHRRARTRRIALVVLVLTAALAGSGYVVLRSPDGSIAGALGRGSEPAASASTDPADPSKQPTGQPRPEPRRDVQSLAGRHAGTITGVEVQKTASCAPGGLCPVTVTVHFRAGPTTQPVVWKVGAARLCERGITWSPPVTVTAQPGWTTVYASSSVAVPKGRSLALVALTTTPARAQSRPVPVTGSSLRC